MYYRPWVNIIDARCDNSFRIDCDYYVLLGILRQHIILHITYTHCIETIVCSIRYFNCRNIGLLFLLVSWWV